MIIAYWLVFRLSYWAFLGGWLGWSTAGAGIAAADITGYGRPDLVVLHVNAPEGENRMYHRAFLR